MTSSSIVLTDEPQWSSASLCITLNHLGKKNRPEYTHQLIECENFRGCRPIESVLLSASCSFKKGESVPSTTLLHKSHEFHHLSESELDVQVLISPSCQKCSVSINRFPISNCGVNVDDIDKEKDCKTEEEVEIERTTKRPKIGNDDSNSYQALSSLPTSSDDITSAKRHPASDSEILSALSRALPPIIQNDNEVKNNFLSEPIGTILYEYSVLTTPQVANATIVSTAPSSSSTHNCNNFIVTIADGSSLVSEYHKSVEKLALFYIENADSVNVSNTDGGYWKIIYLWQKDDDDVDEHDNKNSDDETSINSKFKYSLAGYMTLFHFIALFHKPEPGLIVRVCQALVLPPFQSQGHGKKMLQTVYDLAHNKIHMNTDDNYSNVLHKVIQVNVEDPAPAFVALRNKIDWKLIIEHYRDWNWPRSKGIIMMNRHNTTLQDELLSFFTPLTDREASEMSTRAKISSKQIQLMNELLKLNSIREFTYHHEHQKLRDAKYDDNENKIEVDELIRYFRLMIKRRLNKEYRDDLIELPTKDDQKKMLGELFEGVLKQYEKILHN